MELQELINKYHVPAPRYTSYPTVPNWNPAPPTQEEWSEAVKTSFGISNKTEGISLYIHLPFCEDLCTYCGCNTRITKNHRVELPYIQSVLKEWAMYLRLLGEKPIIKELHLGGGTPTFFSPENLRMLIKGIFEGSELHPNAEFSFEAHPANTTAEHLETLYSLGFRRLSLGIQDFDPRVQIIINRIQTYKQVKDVTEKAREIGYNSINYDLIYGLPLQTEKGLTETISLVSNLMPDRIAFYSYAHVPWIKPGQRKFTEEHLPNVAEKQRLYETGRELFKKLGYEEIGMDHFALKTDSLYQAAKKATLHRNFMGYTHQYTRLMISLGVSSISDTWHAFAQNVKKVEEYMELVETGKFPIFKGHLLTPEDIAVRTYILQLMCTGEAIWQQDLLRVPALQDALHRLKYLERDGLVLADQRSVKVTPLGLRFLRNICMALDARLWASTEDRTRFSMAG